MRLRSERVAWREVEDEIVALDLQTSTYFSANDTASLLMKALADGGATERDLVQRLIATFEVDEATASSDTRRFLEMLNGQGLLDPEDG